MWKKLADSNLSFVYCAMSAIISCLIGIFLPSQWFLPFLNTLFVYPIYVVSVSSGQLKRAFLQMLVWTIFMCLTIITLANILPDRTGQHIIHGIAYKQEMFTWVKTGVGAESHLEQFLPTHLIHYFIFSITTVITGGFAGLLFGSVLLNYMNFYVGSLIRESHFAWQAIFMGWQFYAMVRVAGFITLAIALSHLFFVTIKKGQLNKPLMNRYFIGGLSLLLLDILLKTAIAPGWQKILQPILP